MKTNGFTPDNDGLLSRKMTVGRFMESKNVGWFLTFLRRKMSTDRKIWFYKNLRKKDVESAWQSVETGV